MRSTKSKSKSRCRCHNNVRKAVEGTTTGIGIGTTGQIGHIEEGIEGRGAIGEGEGEDTIEGAPRELIRIDTRLKAINAPESVIL